MRKTHRLHIYAESVAGRVDREAGVIRGVKVCGLESSRGRRYPADVLRRAVTLYEGAKVNIDHPAKGHEHDCRAADAGLGELFNVRMEKDGLYADMRILTSHPMAERVMEAAEKMPTQYALSHNVFGYEQSKGGERIITEITKVNSVDLVRDGATNKSLFEDDSMNPDEMGLDAAPAEPAAGGDQWASLVSDVMADSSLDLAAKKKKIMAILQAQEKVETAGAEAPAKAEEGEGESSEEKKDEEKEYKPAEKKESATVNGKGANLLESLQKEVADLKKQLSNEREDAKLKALCESAKVNPAPHTLKALRGLNDKERQEFLNDLKQLYASRTRSQGRDTVLHESKKPTTVAEFASAIYE